MICAICAHPTTRVIDTRDCPDGSTRRRRTCAVCKKRFTTYERHEAEAGIYKERIDAARNHMRLAMLELSDAKNGNGE